eukprot:scaffold2006_cov141-Isochrysis_galbana.AAC.15
MGCAAEVCTHGCHSTADCDCFLWGAPLRAVARASCVGARKSQDYKISAMAHPLTRVAAGAGKMRPCSPASSSAAPSTKHPRASLSICVDTRGDPPSYEACCAAAKSRANRSSTHA